MRRSERFWKGSRGDSMLKITNKEHYDKTWAEAESNGSLDDLIEQLEYLHVYGGIKDPEKYRVSLGYDWAGFGVVWEMRNGDDEYKFFMNGGLIYHESDGRWSVHT